MHVMLQINSKATSQQTALPQVDRPKLKEKLQEMVAPDPIMVGGCPDGEELAYGDDCPAGLAELDKKGETSIPYDSCCLPKKEPMVGGCAGTEFGCCPEHSWHPDKPKPGPNKPKDKGCYYYDLE